MERCSARRALKAGEADTDDELVLRAGRGDPAAIRALVARKLPRILALAQRMLFDAAEAEDVAQETFIRVWKNAIAWRPGEARVRHLAAPGSAEPLLRPAAPAPGAAHRRPARTRRSWPRARPQPARPGRRQAGGSVTASLAASPAGSDRAVPLPGTGEYRGRGADAGQRRGAGEPAVARTAGLARRPGRSRKRGRADGG